MGKARKRNAHEFRPDAGELQSEDVVGVRPSEEGPVIDPDRIGVEEPDFSDEDIAIMDAYFDDLASRNQAEIDRRAKRV